MKKDLLKSYDLYAGALLDLAISSKTTPEICDDARKLKKFFFKTELNFSKAFDTLTRDQAYELWEKLIGVMELSKLTKCFLLFLTLNHLIGEAEVIFDDFLLYNKVNKGTHLVKILSARSMSVVQKDEIKDAMSSISDNFILNFATDNSLIAGNIIFFDHYMIENSLRSELKHLKRNIIEEGIADE